MKLKHIAAIIAAATLAGCASVKYGDGKVGPVPLDKGVEAAAAYVDSVAPGQGDKLRRYFARSKIDRVPDGYVIAWYVKEKATGKLTPEKAWQQLFERVPDLEPANNPATPAMGISDAANDVTLNDVTSALTPEQAAQLFKLLGK